MAWTLTEAQKMTNDVLLKGIIETIIKESPILDKISFRTIVGNGLVYNRESTLPTANWYSPGDTWDESTGTRAQYTAALKILGGDTDLDEFEKQTMSDQNDLEATLIEEKSKAIAHTFEDVFLYGNATTNTKQFDGLQALCDSTMRTNMGSSTTGAALNLNSLDAAIDAIKPGKPDCLIMNKTIRRRISQFYRTSAGASYHMERGEDGKRLDFYGDIPILVSDFITQTEALSSGDYNAKTGGATSSIYIMKFGQKDLCGLQNGGIQKKRLGELESKDAVRWRIKWYCGLALFSIYSLAIVDGITDAAVTAA